MKSKHNPQRRKPPAKSAPASALAAPAHELPVAENHLSPSSRPGLFAGLLVALVVIAYFPALRADFVWDDDLYVTENATLESLDGLRLIWFSPRSLPQYYPLVYTTFWIEHHLWGLHPMGYHAVNIVLQALCALLLWRLLARLDVPGAWLAAAIFAIHPVQVESVAWVTERKNVLSMAFALGSILCYLRFAPPEAAEARKPTAQQWRYYAWSCLLFALALLSKTAVTPLPGALLVIYWWKRGRLDWRQIWPTLPLFGLSAAAGGITVWVENNVVRAIGSEYDRTPLERILVAGRALWFYAGKLAWPDPIITFYPRWDVDPHAWWQYVFPLAAVAVIAGLWMARRTIGRGPLAAGLIFAGMLVPALGFFNIYFTRYSYVADHFQYHASPALIALAVAVACAAGARGSSSLRNGMIVGSVVLLALLAGLTFRQSSVYYNRETYYRDVIAKNPDGATAAYLNLSIELGNQGRFDEALEMVRTRLKLTPTSASALRTLGEILIARGEWRGFNRVDLDEAVTALTKAVQSEPDEMMGRGQLGRALLELNRIVEARKIFESLVEQDPNCSPALFGLGIIANKNGNTSEAIALFQRATHAHPNYAKAYHALGVLLMEQGQLDDAARSLATAVELHPNWPEAHYDLGNACFRQGKLPVAMEHYDAALKLRPDYIDARINLGIALAQSDELDRAIAQFQEALRLQPGHPSAQKNLEKALEKQREHATPSPAEKPAH